MALLPLAWITSCGGGGGKDSTGSGTVPPAVIASFTASPPAITWGQSSTLAWSVTGAQSLSLDFGIGPVTGTSISVSPDDTTTYTLRALNPAGNSTSATATVTLVRPTALTTNFVPLADGNTYAYDDGTTLSVSNSGGFFVLNWRASGNTFYRIFLQAGPEGWVQTKEEQWCDPTDYRHLLWEGAPNSVEAWHYWASPFKAFPWGLKIGESDSSSRDEEVSIPAGTTGGVTGGCATIPWTDWKFIHQSVQTQVVSAQKVTVPAGKFDALWVNTYQSESNNPFNACGSNEAKRMSYWLAAGVGIVQYQPDANDPRVIHLVSYSVK